MKSHDFAVRLVEIARVLSEKPEFELPYGLHFYQSYSDKKEFIAAVRALGAGKKNFTTNSYPYSELQFTANAVPEIYLRISRDKVCVKVRDEEWSCEPMLSQQEEAESITTAGE